MNTLNRSRHRPDTAPAVLGAVALVVALVCLIAYGLALTGPLFSDDITSLIGNPLLKIDGQSFDGWRVAAISSDAGILCRPIALLSFAAHYVVAGEFEPLSLKATNVALHLLTGVLIFYLCRLLLQASTARDTPPIPFNLIALAATGLWLLHPLHVSTVLHAVQRTVQLSTLLIVAGLWVFTHYRLRWSVLGATTGEVLAAVVWLLLVTGFAILSGEMGVLLPWLLVVIEAALFRGHWCGQSRPWLQRIAWVLLLLPLLLLASLLLLDAGVAADRAAVQSVSQEQHLLTQGRVLWQYLSWSVLPTITSMGLFHDDIALSNSLWHPYSTALAVLAWLMVMLGAVVLRNRVPLLLFTVLFFLVSHALGTMLPAVEVAFEPSNYLPSVGVCLLVAVGLFQLCKRFEGLGYPLMMGVVLLVVGAQLVLRTTAWSDELSLAKFNVTHHPESAQANLFYGNTLFERFSQAQALALDAEQQKILAVNARSYFARAHELDTHSFAPIVMLYQMDTLYFPGLAQENDWLAKLEAGAENGHLLTSDFAALGTLVRVVDTPAGAAARLRVRQLFDQLITRYPSVSELLVSRYRLMVAVARPAQSNANAADSARLRELLEDAAQQGSSNTMLYAFLVQNYGAHSTADTYAWLKAWMQADTARRDLPIVLQVLPK